MAYEDVTVPDDAQADSGTSQPQDFTFGDKPNMPAPTGMAGQQNLFSNYSNVPGRNVTNAASGMVSQNLANQPDTINFLGASLPNPVKHKLWEDPNSVNDLVGLAAGGGEFKALGSALVKDAPIAAKGIAGLFQPGKASQEFVQGMQGGSGTAEQNISSVTNKILSAHDTNLAQAITKKQNVLNATKDIPDMYQSANPGLAQLYRIGSNSPRIEQTFTKDMIPGDTTDEVLNATSNFFKNRSFANADIAQSEIGNRMGLLMRLSRQDNLDRDGLAELRQLKNAHDAIGTDQSNFLNSVDPKLNDEYESFKSDYKNNVRPYYSSPTLNKIVRGRQTAGFSPEQISNEFAWKGLPNAEKVGNQVDPDAAKIAQDIGQEGRNNILYNELLKRNINPADSSGVRETMMDLKNRKGFESYVTPNAEQTMNAWKAKERAKMGLGYGIAGVGTMMGHPILGAAASAPLVGKSVIEQMMKLFGQHK